MCQANFVWSRNQIELFAQYGIDNCFILGVPYDIEAPSEVTNEVVLVGHCGRESSDAEYFYTVSQFIKIHQILCDAGCIVSYRPHPQDDLEMVKSVFPNVTRTLTKDLLRSRRGVYIGFASTFMFECKNSGSVVIGLATDWLSDERDFSVDAEVQPSEYAELPALVRKLTMELYDKPMPDLAPLSSRLSCCMDELRTSMQE
ncbi:MAG TPA: hypothetical protein EYQ14_01655 [Gammaproteobacteria bacterium]|nr:hypothetical protein [Gammaproteobacteria bacterium]HIL99046.1 hypothetical protein [Pseudomonadales bacterium]